jgi:hypothetical protein
LDLDPVATEGTMAVAAASRDWIRNELWFGFLSRCNWIQIQLSTIVDRNWI